MQCRKSRFDQIFLLQKIKEKKHFKLCKRKCTAALEWFKSGFLIIVTGRDESAFIWRQTDTPFGQLLEVSDRKIYEIKYGSNDIRIRYYFIIFSVRHRLIGDRQGWPTGVTDRGDRQDWPTRVTDTCQTPLTGVGHPCQLSVCLHMKAD